jgi:hypothetical protein
MGEWRYRSTICNLGTGWRWVVSFTPLSLYLRGEIVAGTHWIRRLGGPQSRSGCCWEDNSLPCRESNPSSSALQPVARRYTHWVIPAPSKWKFPHTLITWGEAIYVFWINTGTFRASSIYLRTLPRHYFIHYTDSPLWRNKRLIVFKSYNTREFEGRNLE